MTFGKPHSLKTKCERISLCMHGCVFCISVSIYFVNKNCYTTKESTKCTCLLPFFPLNFHDLAFCTATTFRWEIDFIFRVQCLVDVFYDCCCSCRFSEVLMLFLSSVLLSLSSSSSPVATIMIILLLLCIIPFSLFNRPFDH